MFEGKQGSVGSVEARKNADLVVVKGDPSERIADIENTEIVFKDGIGYDSEKLLRSISGRYGQYYACLAHLLDDDYVHAPRRQGERQRQILRAEAVGGRRGPGAGPR